MNKWQNCKKILCIRPDNMGDLIMTIPAIRALRKTFNASITILTSSMAAGIASHIAEIDEVITFDVPWVKLNNKARDHSFNEVVEQLKCRCFDAAVIFNVYSQNPLPAVMLAYLAGIPLRLAYCRENPYHLLTNWMPDQEPYTFIKHQVRRDLELVAAVGANTRDEKLALTTRPQLWPEVINKLSLSGFDTDKPWLILHAGVSEIKRQYPVELWIKAAKLIIEETGCQLVLTGAAVEKDLTDELHRRIGKGSVSAGGLFTLDELLLLIDKCPLLLAVNTGTIHIAAALETPVVVLYALTNPQHTPWQVPCKILPFEIDDGLHSKNEIVKYVSRFYKDGNEYPSAAEILSAVRDLLADPETGKGHELTLINRMAYQRSLC